MVLDMYWAVETAWQRGEARAENVNMANLAGVIKYLHTEVVIYPGVRAHDTGRILR